MTWVSEQLLPHEDWRRDLPLLDDPGLLARYRAAMDGQAVGRMVL